MSEENVSNANEGPAQSKDPFEGFKIGNWQILEELSERSSCPKCNKSRKYFCYTCHIPVPALKDHVPKVKLPVKIDIIKHAKEIDGKSTAVHAAVLAPDDVTVYTYPCIPNYVEEEKVVLIFPGKNALTIPEYLAKYSRRSPEPDDNGPVCKKGRRSNDVITRAVFIDSTWNQSRGIYKDQRLRSLPCVVLQSRISEFWRHQHGSPRWFLATIEAVHQFLVELFIHSGGEIASGESAKKCGFEVNSNAHVPEKLEAVAPDKKVAVVKVKKPSESKHENPEKAPSKFVKNLALCRDGVDDGDSNLRLLGPQEWKDKYDGRYDNLLFFFRFMYSKIHQIYDPDKLRSYKRAVE